MAPKTELPKTAETSLAVWVEGKGGLALRTELPKTAETSLAVWVEGKGGLALRTELPKTAECDCVSVSVKCVSA